MDEQYEHADPVTGELPEPPEPEGPEEPDESPDPFDRLLGLVESHDGALGELQESVKWLLDQFTDDGEQKFKPVLWSWRYVTGENREKLWEHLSDYIAWINRRYFSTDHSRYILPCWYRHGVVVEELTGMWAAWWEAMYNHRSPTSAYADYHRRFFWPGLEVIDRHLKGCRDARKGHQEMSPVDLSPDPDMEQIIAGDVADHPDVDRTHTL
ncbi:hypothetical protein NBM05_03795 [Rothia sp. AR01]|uniref:DUF4913 domain-containing protein n=1 Tax=Rothia santali TaxID=2949643 RepID=A0A9X2KKL2_9MICC|nr:hypothetical protein [Rothia santali]MCP3425171.1 hypothetical protein [Rothia santali]